MADMSYKTILVFLEERDHCDASLDVAVRIANAHEAHLIGVAIQRPFHTYSGLYADLGVSAELDKVLMEREKERLADLQARFAASTKDQNFVAEWRALSSHPSGVTSTLLHQAATAELLILADDTDTDVAHPVMRDRGVLVTGCACPVLSCPSDGASNTIGEFVLVAWDGSKQASRAVFNTLPVLHKAKQVWLHRVNSASETKAHTDGLARDLAMALSRKGVDVELGFSDCKFNKVGEEILRVAGAHGADSIVMGAYGHTRLRDLVLGGATSYLLEHSKLPLFLNG